MKTISLRKGRHLFRIDYEEGQESNVLDHLLHMVDRKGIPFDWFDASLLSHQLGQHLAKKLHKMIPNKSKGEAHG